VHSLSLLAGGLFSPPTRRFAFGCLFAFFSHENSYSIIDIKDIEGRELTREDSFSRLLPGP
jgi:hypothetical protein